MLALSDSIQGGTMIDLKDAGACLKGRIGRFVLLLSLTSLGACASFRGQPEPVIDDRALAIGGFSMARALGLFNTTVLAAYNSPNDLDRCVVVNQASPTCGLTQQAYRNYVIGAYLAAANDRYGEFTRALRVQSRGSSFILDVGALGLATGASFASENTANVLAAIAGGLTGTRGIMNREVYLEQTIPALIGAMEAARTRQGAIILAGLARPVTEYSLEMALNDVQAYEQAATLDNAVQALTEDAANRVEDANNFAEGVREYTGPAEPGVSDLRTRIRARLFELSSADDRAALLAIANDVGLEVADDATSVDIRRALQLRVAQSRTMTDTEDLARKIGLDMGDD